MMVKITGHVKVKLNGEVIREGHNLVVNAGLDLIASLLAGSGSIPSYAGIGTDSSDPTAAQTALVGQVRRVAITSIAAVNNTVTVAADFTGTNVGTESIKEFGVFNAATAGTMLARFITSTISFAVGDTLQLEWSINIGELG